VRADVPAHPRFGSVRARADSSQGGPLARGGVRHRRRPGGRAAQRQTEIRCCGRTRRSSQWDASRRWEQRSTSAHDTAVTGRGRARRRGAAPPIKGACRQKARATGSRGQAMERVRAGECVSLARLKKPTIAGRACSARSARELRRGSQAVNPSRAPARARATEGRKRCLARRQRPWSHQCERAVCVVSSASNRCTSSVSRRKAGVERRGTTEAHGVRRGGSNGSDGG
jgi:hypothetical protein